MKVFIMLYVNGQAYYSREAIFCDRKNAVDHWVKQPNPQDFVFEIWDTETQDTSRMITTPLQLLGYNLGGMGKF